MMQALFTLPTCRLLSLAVLFTAAEGRRLGRSCDSVGLSRSSVWMSRHFTWFETLPSDYQVTIKRCHHSDARLHCDKNVTQRVELGGLSCLVSTFVAMKPMYRCSKLHSHNTQPRLPPLSRHSEASGASGSELDRISPPRS